MCFDPVSLGLLAAGTAASVVGGSMSRSEATKNEQAQAAAKNAELRATLDRQKAFGDQNASVLSDVISKFSPQAQGQNALGADQKREDAVVANMTPPQDSTNAVPLGDTPNVIKGAYASRMADKFAQATAEARAKAKFGSYGDVWTGNNLTTTGGARSIDTTNTLARDDAALLSSRQDLAGYTAARPPSGIGDTLSALGGLVAGAAGRRAGAPGGGPGGSA